MTNFQFPMTNQMPASLASRNCGMIAEAIKAQCQKFGFWILSLICH